MENSDAVHGILGLGTISRSVFIRSEHAVAGREAALYVDHSQFADNAIGVLSHYSGDGIFTENTFVRNETALLSSFMSWDPVVRGNRFLDNGMAVQLELGGLIDGNDLRDNDRGIVRKYEIIFNAYTLTITNNHLVRNGDGIVVPIRASVGSNVVVDGSGWGINTPEAVDLGGNVAHGNGREPQCVGVVCSAGGS